VKKRNFKPEDFAFIHPSGSLGKKLLLTVSDIWHTGEELPVVTLDTSIKDLLYTISSKGFGCTAVVEEDGQLIGIITDGDLRRSMEKYSNINKMYPKDIMSRNPKSVQPDELAVKALAIMEKYSITSLLSTDKNNKPLGIIHLHDLLKAGIA
jgi:arabinose-5-phosphate isomerase